MKKTQINIRSAEKDIVALECGIKMGIWRCTAEVFHDPSGDSNWNALVTHGTVIVPALVYPHEPPIGRFMVYGVRRALLLLFAVLFIPIGLLIANIGLLVLVFAGPSTGVFGTSFPLSTVFNFGGVCLFAQGLAAIRVLLLNK